MARKRDDSADDLAALRTDLRAATQRAGARVRVGELRPVTAEVGAGERVGFLAKGSFTNNVGLVVVTDSRLLFFFSGVMPVGLDVPLGRIESVTSSSGLSTGQVSLVVAGEEKPVVIARVVKGDLEPLVHAVRQAVAAAPPLDEAPDPVTGEVDPFVAMEKLSALRDRGVLTEAEFAAKKQELLDRL